MFSGFEFPDFMAAIDPYTRLNRWAIGVAAMRLEDPVAAHAEELRMMFATLDADRVTREWMRRYFAARANAY